MEIVIFVTNKFPWILNFIRINSSLLLKNIHEDLTMNYNIRIVINLSRKYTQNYKKNPSYLFRIQL